MDDYHVWKKHTADLYDVVITHGLDWPVTSAQWLPDHQRILLGSKALDDPHDCLENCVLIVKLAVPADLDAEIHENWMTQWIKHEEGQDVASLHLRHHTTKHENSGGLPSQVISQAQPEMLLKGHTKGGHGLPSGLDAYVGLTRSFQSSRAHRDPLESLAYHPYDEFCLATSSCDNTARIFDTRALSQPLHTFVGHMDTVVCVAWSPNHPSVLVTSAEDHRLMLWDVKRIGEEQSAEDAKDGPPELLFITVDTGT
ncbi:hypothetical protein SELMODRAFT_431142 [Selaginella moellendorffii]|uniref:Histone-binding protein RBBP4-like N-terminal domain-containing protein n=1 Tax=Selaginella moellendorffii TaxID=88036 RepID=D8TBN3_SELML|nr:hypothetical protein SELMODRAFT_431142 [Selaginella moellendorffii]